MQQEQQLDPTSPSESAAGFPPLKTIWDDQYCQKCNVGNEKGVGVSLLRAAVQASPSYLGMCPLCEDSKGRHCHLYRCYSGLRVQEIHIDLWSHSQERMNELMMVKMAITEDKEERVSMATNCLFEESNKKPMMSTKMR
jgi:hypothetical protein